jgi:NitT/TauT family transport system permease protein
MLVKKWLSNGLVIFMFFLVWLLLSSLVNTPLLVPSPTKVLSAFIELIGSTTSSEAILHTFFRLLLASTSSFIIGVIGGLLSGFSPFMKAILHPIATVFRTIPVVSIIVIVLILLGMRFTPYVITFLMLFPISYQATYEGMIRIDSELIDVYHLDDHHPIRMIRYCILPLIAGYLKTALLQSAGLGIKVLVMAEYLAQTPRSIGYQLYLEKVFLRYDFVFAWTLLLIVLALLFEFAIHQSKQWLEKQPISDNLFK